MPKPGTYQPKAVQTRVVAARLAGKSTSRIAREQGINRRTVVRILSMGEYLDLQNQYRQQFQTNVPAALEVVQNKLMTRKGKTKPRADWRLAIEVLKGTQVYVSKEVSAHAGGVDDYAGWTDEQLRKCLTTGERPTTVIDITPTGEPGNGDGPGRNDLSAPDRTRASQPGA
jgi:hypothetical protein